MRKRREERCQERVRDRQKDKEVKVGKNVTERRCARKKAG